MPTRVDERTKTSSLIDNIYTNIPESDTDMKGVLKTHISDHYSIVHVHKNSNRIIDKQYRVKRNFSEKKKFLFKKTLKMDGWANIFNHGDAQLAYSQFSTKMKTYFDLHFPIQRTEVKYSNRNEWINNTLKKEIIERERLFIYKKKYPTQENKEKYKKFRNQNISNQRKAERDYYQDQFELNSNDLRKSWKVIKNIIQKSENKFSCNNEEFVINNKITSDGKEIANGFNNYFVNIGRSLAQQITSTINPLSYINTNINSIYIPDILKNEIITVIYSLKNSSPGYDEMSASISKQCLDTYIDPLTYLINLSINQGIFPDELKIAKVLPIYKSDDKHLIQNYRPISVLPFFSKIFEKINLNHLENFIESNNI